MKKMLLIVAFSCLLIKISAQAPILTTANTSPKPGDSYISQTAATAGVTTPTGGIGQNWNYSNLVDSGETIAFQAVLPSSTPFADSFPLSNVAIKTAGDSVYIYFNSTTAALLQNGVATSDSLILRSDPARTYLPYPFTYNSFFISPVTVQYPGYDFSFTGTDSIRGDGYGTLSIPGKTYSNVLRIQYIENLSSKIDSGFFSVTTNIRIVNYLYYTPDTHAPLLSDGYTETTVKTTIFGNTIVNTNSDRAISYLKTFVLPVTFQSFKASLQNKDVLLQWNTAQEINTDHFILQRSLTGRDFQDITSVKAAGSTQGSAYHYTDKSFAAGIMPATVYYRIQETDKDGRQTLSDVAIVRGGHAVVISVYPNPASHYIRIAGSGVAIADVIAIYDTKGSLLQQWRNYSISQPIGISNLTKGTYLVKVIINGKTTTTTLVKQ